MPHQLSETRKRRWHDSCTLPFRHSENNQKPAGISFMSTAFLCIAFLFQAIASGPEITFMPLETVYKAWVKKNAAVKVRPDSVVGQSRLGEAVVEHWKTKSGLRKLIVHKTADGKIWDAGLFDPQLHVTALADYFDYIYVAERMSLAIYFGDVQFARSVMTLGELEIASGVGDQMERVSSLLESLKGYNETVFVRSVKFEDGRFAAEYEAKSPKGPKRFTILQKPSANLFLNGQFYLLQDQLVQQLKVNAKAGRKWSFWSGFITERRLSNGIEIRFPDFKPYGTVHLYNRSGAVWQPVLSGKDEKEEMELALRAFWTSTALPDSFGTGTRVVQPDYVEVLAETRAVNAARAMRFGEWRTWIQTTFHEVLPVYYGPMADLKFSGDSAFAVGSWSIVDPHLKMEHLFKVQQTLVRSVDKWEMKRAVITATFGIRLDNVIDLHGKGDGISDPALTPFKIDLRKNAN